MQSTVAGVHNSKDFAQNGIIKCLNQLYAERLDFLTANGPIFEEPQNQIH